MSKRCSWRITIVVVALVILAAAIRVAFAALPRLVRWDEAAYLMIGRSLIAGKGFAELAGTPDLQQPPLVAFLSVLGLWMGLPIPWAAAALSHVLIGSLVVVPVFEIAREFFGPKVAAIAGTLAAIYPALAVSPLLLGHHDGTSVSAGSSGWRLRAVASNRDCVRTPRPKTRRCLALGHPGGCPVSASRISPAQRPPVTSPCYW